MTETYSIGTNYKVLVNYCEDRRAVCLINMKEYAVVGRFDRNDKDGVITSSMGCSYENGAHVATLDMCSFMDDLVTLNGFIGCEKTEDNMACYLTSLLNMTIIFPMIKF